MYMWLWWPGGVCLALLLTLLWLLRGLPSSYTYMCSRFDLTDYVWSSYGTSLYEPSFVFISFLIHLLFGFHALLIFQFSFMIMLFVSYSCSFVAYAYFTFMLCFVYICSLGFLSSAAFLFLRQVLVGSWEWVENTLDLEDLDIHLD